MASSSSVTHDEAIRVVVTPSQASYFAGETFSVTITFTNTRTPEAPAAPRSASHAHKRGAHSISSVPLARPPTSPGTPRTVVPVFPSRSAREGNSGQRKGLIGHGLPPRSTDEPPSADVLRKRLLASRSLSVSLTPQDLPPKNPSNEAPSVPASPLSAASNGEWSRRLGFFESHSIQWPYCYHASSAVSLRCLICPSSVIVNALHVQVVHPGHHHVL